MISMSKPRNKTKGGIFMRNLKKLMIGIFIQNLEKTEVFFECCVHISLFTTDLHQNLNT